MLGQAQPRAWLSCPTLSRPLTILGVERRLCILIGVGGMNLFLVTDRFLLALTFTAIAYAVGLAAMQRDPDLIAVVREGARLPARLDPAKRPRLAEEIEIVEDAA